jgi:uncharacterized protein (DUF2236 family)
VTGLLYHANDVDLLLWVHCVLVESSLSHTRPTAGDWERGMPTGTLQK